MLCPDEAATRAYAAELASRLREGDVVLLEGPLGAGKTTFVRGVMEGLGHLGPVRSPTFNLLQVFDTTPPILHADLYRVPSAASLGIEEYLETHACLIEWAEKAEGLIDPEKCWKIRIEFQGEGRKIEITPPKL